VDEFSCERLCEGALNAQRSTLDARRSTLNAEALGPSTLSPQPSASAKRNLLPDGPSGLSIAGSATKLRDYRELEQHGAGERTAK
jgi:hypothetical protein